MNPIGLILREMAHRWVGTTLMVVAVASTVGLLVFFQLNADAETRETKRIQRDAGPNLTLLPRTVDLGRYLLDGTTDETLDEALLDRLLGQGAVSMNHLIAVLQRRVDVEGHTLILTGIAKSRAVPGRPKSPMHRGVTRGELDVGSQVASLLDLDEGGTVQVVGQTFTVRRVLLEQGTSADLTLFGDLVEVQEALDLAGRVSEVRAIDCVSCDTPGAEPLRLLREELAVLAPEVQVLRAADRADTRLRQRTLVERHLVWVVTGLLIAALLSTAALAMLNVRERRAEIGVLRALGHGRGRVLGLFMGKALVVGVLAGVVGAAAGSYAALARVTERFPETGDKLTMPGTLWVYVLVGAPLLTMLASWIPATWAATQDPADTLQPS